MLSMCSSQQLHGMHILPHVVGYVQAQPSGTFKMASLPKAMTTLAGAPSAREHSALLQALNMLDERTALTRPIPTGRSLSAGAVRHMRASRHSLHRSLALLCGCTASLLHCLIQCCIVSSDAADADADAALDETMQLLRHIALAGSSCDLHRLRRVR